MQLVANRAAAANCMPGVNLDEFFIGILKLKVVILSFKAFLSMQSWLSAVLLSKLVSSLGFHYNGAKFL